MSSISKTYLARVGVEDLPSIALQWRKLEKTTNPGFFQTWTWIGAWAELIVKQTELYLFKSIVNQTTTAMCFVTLCNVKRCKNMITSRQVQINEYLGDKCNMVIPYNKPLTNVDNEKLAWKNLLDALDNWNKSWDEISISSLPEKSLSYIPNTAKKFTTYTDKEYVKWMLPINKKCHDRDQLYLKFSGKFRHTLRHSLKVLEKEYGKIDTTIAKSTDQALDYFDKMKALHTARWEKAGRAGSFANKNWVEFHQNIIKNGFPRDEIYIVEISTSALKLGYIYGHLYAGIAHMHQTGFKVTNNNKLRPGYVSHFESMHLLALAGLEYYDLLPDEKNSYKKHLTNASSKIYWIRLQRPKLKFFIEQELRNILKIKFVRLVFNKLMRKE